MRFVNSFQIRTTIGLTSYYEIADLDHLVQHISAQSLASIAKVSFYITDDENPREFCNVIIRNHDEEGFIPESYYKETAEADLNLVLRALEAEADLHEMFVQNIRVEKLLCEGRDTIY